MASYSPFDDPDLARIRMRTIPKHMLDGAHYLSDIDNLSAVSLADAEAVNRDRAQARARGLSEEEVRADFDANLKRVLTRKLFEAHADLPGVYLAMGLRIPTRERLLAAMAEVLGDPTAMPGGRVGSVKTLEFSIATQHQDPRRKRFSRHRSAGMDRAHCVVGAYCDIFTCDTEAGEQLAGAREALGLQRQLTEKGCGGVEGLVRAVREQMAVVVEQIS